MLKMSDLEAAAAEGIISRDQAVQLRDFAHRLSATGEEALEYPHDTRDEPFRLLRGFRDFFIAIGVVIFAIGISNLAASATASATSWFDEPGGQSATDFVWLLTVACGLAVTGIGLAEWITRHQRLPLSSLVTSIAFALWSAHLLVVLCAIAWAVLPVGPDLTDDALVWLYFLGGVLATIIFYWRYRLPFTLLLLAGSVAGFVFFMVEGLAGNQFRELHGRVLIGVLGLLSFVIAMWFDAKDPLRVTRFSECGFWLHLLAAPMMVHALLYGQWSDTPNLVVILASMSVLALVALLIDRRALLVAGLSYLAIAIAQVVRQSEFLDGSSFAVTASILGAAVLCLGLGWTPIRRGLMILMPLGNLRSKLPPVAAA